MPQLTKGMYGDQFKRESRLFGIACGQMRAAELVHNGGWYNKDGEKLGWGDLSLSDMDRIASELEEGELFVILGEQDSFWSFVYARGLPNIGLEETAPGKAYVADKARFIV